jgi:chemotaxis protein methyltransferase CheR
MTTETTADDFDRLLEYVERRLGFATSHYEPKHLQRRVVSRLRRKDLDTDAFGAYLEVLREDDAEQAALLDALSINVTSFFRDEGVWRRLRPILRELTEDRSGARVWSAPSSDGREPYSLAMLALDDPEVRERRLDILGTDIDEAALATARKGVYESSETEDLSEQLDPLDDYSRYIDREGDQYVLRDRVTDLVSFEHHDLINGPAKSGFDLVFCRNFFIYIDSEYKDPVLETLEASLRDGGYLVLGKTETMPYDRKGEVFEPVDNDYRIYRKR